jgi:hypothetical protein
LLLGTLHDLGIRSTLVDPDIWIKPATKVNGIEYYEYIFIYVDDLLVLSEDPKAILKTIGEIYRLKSDSVAKPTTCLGALIKDIESLIIPRQFGV